MFFGLDGNTVWCTGVVEDVLDPLKLGRARIRLHVHHTKSKVLNQKTGDGIATEDLPWAYIMNPVTSPGLDGIGGTPFLLPGSHVVCFSRDGNTLCDLVIVGTIGGKPEDAPNIKFGYSDPRTPDELSETPRYDNLQNYPQSDWLKKSSLNRLHKVEELDKTYIKPKREMRKTGIKNILGSWSEKSSDYGAKYPYNHVTETECGHVLELDDTKLKERYSFWHGGEAAEGTFFEFDSKGNYTLKAKLDMDFLANSMNFYSKKNIRITTDANMGIECDNFTIKSDDSTNLVSKKVISITTPLLLINGKPYKG